MYLTVAMSLSAPSFAVLEVYQFARDATVAETWLIAHEPYLRNQDFGDSLDKVESLIKKHEAFEKSAATQEDRFLALERLTTVRRRPDAVYVAPGTLSYSLFLPQLLS